MDEYKLAIIHGTEDLKRNIKVGDIEYIGLDKETLHSVTLLDYAKENHSDINIFEKLNSRHSPEVIGFMFLHYLNDIVFFNTTKDVKRHGYSGLFLLPNTLSKEQEKGLKEFTVSIEKYGVFLTHSLRLEDGMLMGEEVYSVDKESPSKMIEKYLKMINEKENNHKI